MDDSILKLLSIASTPLLMPPRPDELILLDILGEQSDAVAEMLAMKNGWYAFESALHFFPLGHKQGVLDLENWNSKTLWRGDYENLASAGFFFAEDIFGVQFCFKQDEIHTFEPETGKTQPFAKDIRNWAQIILSDFQLHTGFPFAHEWQLKNGPLKPGKRLVPKVPFVLQGPFTIENLHEMDSVKGMKFRATIALQIRDLPDGTRARIRVTE